MNRSSGGAGRHLNGPVWAVRRALAPEALEFGGEVRGLLERASALESEVEALRARVGELEDRQRESADLRDRLTAVEERLGKVDELAALVGTLREGLLEERRLHLRVAELADVVTELVLPLHDREIDPAALARLRPDTL
ncbi:DUF6752 domain-containing protein [Geodermatophilus sp. SYSU D01105]